MFKYKDIYSADSLVEAFGKAQQGSIWKESVQRYEYNLLKNVRRTSDELKNWTYEQYPFYEFTLRERGKTRPIKSMHISDRVVQRSACDNVVRMRRKLKKLKRFYDEGSVPMEDIEQAYQSWRGSVNKFNSHNTLRSMDRLYDELFGKEK